MSVTFNSIPSNLRVPLFYAEVNAGQSPYQGPSRTLLVGQKTSAGSASTNVPIILSGDPTALVGAGSMLCDMALWARQNAPFSEIWMLPLADPSGVAATFTATIASGILGNQGTLVLYIDGQKIQIAVATTDTDANVATNLAAAINLGYNIFGRPMSFGVTAAAASNVVTLTSRHTGTLGNKHSILAVLVGDEGPLAQYIAVAAGTAGTGVPDLSAPLAALGDQAFDFICAPYSDTTSLNTVGTFLNGTAGRWSPLQQLYGLYFTTMFDTYSNLAAFGTGRNDPNVTILGVVESPSTPWQWAAAYGARIAGDKNLGGEVDQAYQISRPVQTLDLVGIRPPVSRVDWFTIVQRNTLYQDGIAGFTVDIDGTVRIDRAVTTYQLNSAGVTDITWLDIETRCQMVYFVRYIKDQLLQQFPRCALADDNPQGTTAIVTVKILKAAIIHYYTDLENGGLVENSDLFATSLIVERSTDPNRVNAYLPVDVVNQFRIFAANVTTFLEFPS